MILAGLGSLWVVLTGFDGFGWFCAGCGSLWVVLAHSSFWYVCIFICFDLRLEYPVYKIWPVYSCLMW